MFYKMNKHIAKNLLSISIISSILVTFFIVMGIINEQIQFLIQIILCMIIVFLLWKLRDLEVPWLLTLIDIVCWLTGTLCWFILPPYMPMLEDVNLYLIMIIFVIYVGNTIMISRSKKTSIEKEVNNENVGKKHVVLRSISFVLIMYIYSHIREIDMVRNLLYTIILFLSMILGFHDLYKKCENG